MMMSGPARYLSRLFQVRGDLHDTSMTENLDLCCATTRCRSLPCQSVSGKMCYYRWLGARCPPAVSSTATVLALHTHARTHAHCFRCNRVAAAVWNVRVIFPCSPVRWSDPPSPPPPPPLLLFLPASNLCFVQTSSPNNCCHRVFGSVSSLRCVTRRLCSSGTVVCWEYGASS